MESHLPSVATLGLELAEAEEEKAPEEEPASPLFGDGETLYGPAGPKQRSPPEPQEEMLDFCGDLDLVHTVQEWQDGCVYQGESGLDMKLGCGQFSWPTGEIYRGQFYRDHRHGVGTYIWPDGSNFTGTFYLSSREGYGTMYLKPNFFKGLYKADRRFGPGVETYPDGSQDVGLWLHEHLIQLCSQVPAGFSVQDRPEFASFLACIPERACISDEPGTEAAPSPEQDPFAYAYKQFLQDDGLALPPDMSVYSTNSDHLPLPHSLRRDLDARIGLVETPTLAKDEQPWPIKNMTPLLVQMQKHTYRFRNRPAHSRWRMDAILAGNRSGFGQPGPKEKLSIEMILKAKEGDYTWMSRILRDKRASPNVADSRGYCVLASAAVHSRTDIIQLLLDFGADVNKCSDEGLTPLAMCFLLYYPAWAFKRNVAERTVSMTSPVQDGTRDTPGLTVRSASSLSSRDFRLDSIYKEVSMPTASEVRLVQTPASAEDSIAGLSSSVELSLESSELWNSIQDGSSSHGGSLSDMEWELDTRSGRQARLSPSSLFESNLCVWNFSVKLSRDALERGALASCLQKVPSLQPSRSNRDTLWRMALSMVQQRSRWLTICLLLRRGADPNLSRVPMPVLFLAVKAGDVDGVRLLLESGARTDIQYPPELRSLTPLHIAAALPGEEGTKITELLLQAITDVDARATDENETCISQKQDLMMSTMKLSGELGPPSNYYNMPASGEGSQGGRTPLHMACERKDNQKMASLNGFYQVLPIRNRAGEAKTGARYQARHAQDVVRLLLSHKADPNMLWSGHSPLSLAIVSGNDLIVKELLIQGADPNLILGKGLGSALCVACDISFESPRSLDGTIALIDRLISYGANILNPVTLTQGDKVAVGTAVDYGYFRFFQDRRIAHSAFHALMPHERDALVSRKRLLEYMGFLLRSAVLAKEAQWEPRALYLSKRAELIHHNRLRRKGLGKKMLLKEDPKQIPFFKFCYQCGRSVGVRLVPCVRCYGVLTCSKTCKGRFWMDIHKKECGHFQALAPRPANQQPEDCVTREEGETLSERAPRTTIHSLDEQ